MQWELAPFYLQGAPVHVVVWGPRSVALIGPVFTKIFPALSKYWLSSPNPLQVGPTQASPFPLEAARIFQLNQGDQICNRASVGLPKVSTCPMMCELVLSND